MARRMAQAPNTYPTWFAPQARVYLEFGSRVLSRFPEHFASVGPPDARLCYRIIEPGDYRLKMTSTNWLEGEHERFKFSFNAVVPESQPTPSKPIRGTVLVLHGYGLEQAVMLPWALRLAEDGWRAVLVDLRGHGKSNGRRIYFGLQEAHDLSQLLDQLPQVDGPSASVAVIGESYGAALALRWKSVEPRVRGVVAIAPYSELLPAVLNIRREYAKWMPTALVKAGYRKLPSVLKVEPGELDTSTVLSRNPVNALFIAGARDAIAPVEVVTRLERQAASPSELIVVPHATHEALPYFFSALAQPVLDWLDGRAPAVTGQLTPRNPGL